MRLLLRAAAMGRRPALLRFVGLALFSSMFGHSPASAQSATPVALVVDRSGEIVAGAQAVATLSAWPAGTRLRLGAAARLKLLYVASGDEYTVTGPGAADIGAAGVATLEGATLARRAADAAKPLRLRAEALTLGGIVMRGGRLRPRHPAGLVTTPPTQLAWDALAADAPYRVELHDAAGALLFEARIQGLSVALPAGLRWAPGTRYGWSVAADVDASAAARHLPPATTSFDFAAAELRDEAARLKPAADAPLADRVVYALWLEQAGATGEARQRWQALADERPDDDALRARAQR